MIAKLPSAKSLRAMRRQPSTKRSDDDERREQSYSPAGIEIYQPRDNGQEREKELSRGWYYQTGREQSYNGCLDQDPWMLDDGQGEYPEEQQDQVLPIIPRPPMSTKCPKCVERVE